MSKSKVNIEHGDALEKLKNLNDGCIDLIITDPPYNLGNFMKKRATNLSAMRSNHFSGKNWDKLAETDWIKSMDAVFKEFSRVSRKKSNVIIFMSIIKLHLIISIAEKYKYYYKTSGIWHKTNPMPRNKDLHFINSTECWLHFTYGSKTATFNNGGKALHDFFESSNTSMSEKKYGNHPTQKPLSLTTYLIEILSNENDFVLDPFMGSGTSAVACLKTNRNFIGFEISKKYFDLCNKRIKSIRNI